MNKPELNTPSYQAYVAGRLRAAFELAGVPVVLRYRSSHDGGGGGKAAKPNVQETPSTGGTDAPVRPSEG